ncbi:MAG: GNAT family N-acetyltransferase [Candidatus Hermodarchaeota archaeon]
MSREKIMRFESLDQFSEMEILDAHNEAFSDYQVPMQLSLDTFQYFNHRRGVRYDLSIGTVEGNKLIGFILNAVDFWTGKLTAYDCGTGVVPKFRQKGIGDQMFKALLPVLKEKDIEQYLLEVIKTNTAGINLYKKRNFLITREFDCLNAERKTILGEFQKLQISSSLNDYEIQKLEKIDWDVARGFWEFLPSWQNSELSIQRVKDSFNYLGSFYQKNLVGYIVYEPHGSITQLAFHADHRTQNIGCNLVNRMLLESSNIDTFNIINVDRRDKYLIAFLNKIGFESFISQYEMILKI